MADPAIQKRILKALLSLPRPVLRAASGGRVVYVAGRTLEPRLQFLLHAARYYASVEGLSEEKARETRAQQLALVAGRRDPGVRTEDLQIETPRGPLAARSFRHPDQDPAMPVMVYAHGGPLDGVEALGSILARCGHTPILAVSLQPGPERRFQACQEDLLAAYRFGCGQAARFGAPEGYAGVGGDAVGGAFAAALCQELKRTGEPQPSLQLLICPRLDLSRTARSAAAAALEPLELEAWEPDRLLGPGDDPSDPRISPLRAEDVTGLAPAIVVTAGFDPLSDQGETYARRLRAAGAPVVYRCYDHLVHGFVGVTGAVPAADVACREIAGLMREGLQGRIPCPGLRRAS